MVEDTVIWEKVLKILKLQVDPIEYSSNIKNIKVDKFEEKILYLKVENKFLKTRIETKFKPMIEEILNDVFIFVAGEEKIKVDISVSESERNFDNYFSNQNNNKKQQNNDTLNTKYRFDNFVVGKSNELANAACIAVSDNPGGAYNPLTIYGGSGLGKTHLMHSVGNKILEKDPTKRIVYCTSEQFNNEFINSLRAGQLTNVQEFREKFRTLDVLLIDDIQFFEKVFGQGSGSVEEEFFHTFNTLQELGKQIIMSSDRLPKEIRNLSKRIESRFESGLSVDVQSPDYETRIAILKNIVEKKQVYFPNDTLEYIAESISSNIRELEGALTRVIARSSLLNKEINITLVQEVLSDIIKNKKSKITADKIIDVVSNYYSITIEDIKGKKRQKEIVNGRQVAMYLLKDYLDLNLTTIGGLFGGRDHTTVISSLRKIETRTKEEISFKKDMENLKNKIVE